jgi:hypothetical protein
MNNSLIFILGFVAFMFAVGPLTIAAYLDWKDTQERQT